MSLEQKAKMCSGKAFWCMNGIEEYDIPSINLSDGPNGLRKQEAEMDHLGIKESIVSVCFPTAAGVASSFDRDLIKSMGETLGNQCQAEDLGILLGPGVNIKRTPLCGRNFEYLSEDPYLAGQMAASYVNGLQSKGVGCSVKHFAVNNQETDRMNVDAIVDERTLREIYLTAFETVVKEAKPKTVMCSYNKINGTYASQNRRLLTEILRDEWGFDGFVVSDWGATQSLPKGISAGLDLRMPGSKDKEVERLIEAVKNGTVDEKDVDKAVERMIDVLKFVKANRDENAVYDREKDHEKAEKIAEETAVLLKNEGNILPLDSKKKIAVIGEFAKKPRYQGSGSAHVNSYKVDNAFDALSEKIKLE